MICRGISFVPDGGSVVFACVKSDIEIDDKNIDTDVLWFTLNKKFMDKKRDTYGQYKLRIGRDKEKFEWVTDDDVLCNLSVSIRNYIQSTTSDTEARVRNWYWKSEDMKLLRRSERLRQLLNRGDYDED